RLPSAATSLVRGRLYDGSKPPPYNLNAWQFYLSIFNFKLIQLLSVYRKQKTPLKRGVFKAVSFFIT
ncbi:MAG: hypothetical protein J6C75_04020, partial [Oscillospiraceae bacterium]|nr:hypothetical protein [Oscillospiraceae bacterium]